MIEGLDISSYQPSDLETFKNWKRKGSEFVFVKLTEGLGYKNPYAGAQITSAFKAKMQVVGAYHFFHGNGVAEAKQFLYTVQQLGLDKSTPLMLDAETPDIGGTANCNAFIDYCYAQGYKNLFIYSMASYFGVRINADSLRRHHAKLWVANYGGYIGIDNTSIWQYTDRWRGLHVDGNYAYFPKDLGIDGNEVQKKSPYYSDGSKFKVISDEVTCYKDTDFTTINEKIVGRKRGYVIKAKPVKVGNIYRLKTAYGNYYTANRKYVEKVA